MYAADPGVDQRLDRGVGVVVAAGVVGVVDDGGGAGVQSNQGGDEGADVVVVRAVQRPVAEGGEPR